MTEDAWHWMLAVGVVLGAIVVADTAFPQGAGKKSYRDARFGVNFEYPAQWTVERTTDAAVYFVPAPRVLAFLSGDERPLVRVGFAAAAGWTPYPHSTLEGAELVVVAFPEASVKACRERVALDGESDPTSLQIGGVSYFRVSAVEEGPHHAIDRTIYAAYRQGRCFVFEEDIHEVRAATDDDLHVLRPEEQAVVRRQLESAMNSVRFLGGLEH